MSAPVTTQGVCAFCGLPILADVVRFPEASHSAHHPRDSSLGVVHVNPCWRELKQAMLMERYLDRKGNKVSHP